jgi:hypothetical protein
VIGILDFRVAKFLSNRERFARRRDPPAYPAESFAIFWQSKLP